jgi:hypothetical protein
MVRLLPRVRRRTWGRSIGHLSLWPPDDDDWYTEVIFDCFFVKPVKLRAIMREAMNGCDPTVVDPLREPRLELVNGRFICDIHSISLWHLTIAYGMWITESISPSVMEQDWAMVMWSGFTSSTHSPTVRTS